MSSAGMNSCGDMFHCLFLRVTFRQNESCNVAVTMGANRRGGFTREGIHALSICKPGERLGVARVRFSCGRDDCGTVSFSRS